MPDPGDSSAILKASYRSPTGSQEFQHVISAPATRDTQPLDTREKTRYLSDLRVSSKKLQEDINRFLTGKMEEDKRTQGQATTADSSKQIMQDELEEETYGEEAVEDDS